MKQRNYLDLPPLELANLIENDLEKLATEVSFMNMQCEDLTSVIRQLCHKLKEKSD